MTTRRALVLLIVASGLIRLGWSACLGPGNDEAYHYLFAVHRDWSYFDHPPMLAVIESIGLAAAGGVVTPFTLRLGFIALFAASTWMMARLTARFHGPSAGFFAAFGLNVTAYYTAAAGVFALPDGPLLFFWLLTLDRLAVALRLDRDPTDQTPARHPNLNWISVGLAWGCALLSKYHAIFLPAGVLVYMLVEPSARHWLRKPGPYLASLAGLLVFSPVIYWNATHGWVSFLFQGGRAVGESGIRFDTLLAALVLPAVYLFPWIWFRLISLFAQRTRHLFDSAYPRVDRFLVCEAILPLTTFLIVACKRPVLPHWTLVGFLPMFPLLGASWDTFRRSCPNPRTFRTRMIVMTVLPVAFMGLALVHARTGVFQKGQRYGIGLVKPANDPTAEMACWGEIGRELRERGLLDQPNTFLFTGNWYMSGQLAFATRDSHTPVLCYHAWDARSFAFWSKPQDYVGRDGILVALDRHLGEPECFERWFNHIEPLTHFQVKRAGAVLREVEVFRCVRQTMAFPFDDLGNTIRSKRSQTTPRIAAAATRPRSQTQPASDSPSRR